MNLRVSAFICLALCALIIVMAIIGSAMSSLYVVSSFEDGACKDKDIGLGVFAGCAYFPWGPNECKESCEDVTAMIDDTVEHYRREADRTIATQTYKDNADSMTKECETLAALWKVMEATIIIGMIGTAASAVHHVLCVLKPMCLGLRAPLHVISILCFIICTAIALAVYFSAMCGTHLSAGYLLCFVPLTAASCEANDNNKSERDGFSLGVCFFMMVISMTLQAVCICLVGATDNQGRRSGDDDYRKAKG